MILNEKFESDFLAMSELTKEIDVVVQKAINENNADLTPMDIEHIIKITSDVTKKIKSQIRELTV